MSRKLIIDTDVGLDDAGAIFLAVAGHKVKSCEIVAITAVHGNTILENVLTNTARTLTAANMKNIPIYRGAHSSLVEPFQQTDPFHGWDGFGDSQHDGDADLSCLQKEHAVNALVRIVSENPGQITLVALGPLTNVAMAMRMDPNFASNLKDLYIMGGNTEGVGNITVSAEFNFHCDPEAAYIVLQNTKCPTYIAPWELCLHRVVIPWDWRIDVMGKVPTAEARLLNKIEAKATENREFGSWIVCDQVAMAAAIDPRAVKKQTSHYAMVELGGKFTRGQMVVDYGKKMQKNPNVVIIDQIDVELFKSMLLWSLGDKSTDYQPPQ